MEEEERRPVNCQELEALNMPVLLVGGEKSPARYGQILTVIEPCLKERERVTIPNASHGMHRMNPIAFNSSVAQFLSKIERSAVSWFKTAVLPPEVTFEMVRWCECSGDRNPKQHRSHPRLLRDISASIDTPPSRLCSSSSPCVTSFVLEFDWSLATRKQMSTTFSFGTTKLGKLIS
jgi:hypothetical protein